MSGGLRDRTRGVLYVATGRRHLTEMLASVESVRRHMPGLPIGLYTDQTDLPEGIFTEIRRLENPRHSFMDKIAPLRATPFERTVFLDTDTYICRPFWDLFEVLDRFEMAVAHAPLRHDRPFSTPNCFVELNTGVMAYRKTETVDALYVDWLNTYEKEIADTGRMDSDQPAFREAIWRSKVSFYVLTAEYNLRTVMPAAAGRGGVRILHGRAKDLAELERWVNESGSIRVFLPGVLQMARGHFGILSRPGRMMMKIFAMLVGPVVWVERVLRTVKRRFFG